MKNKKLNFVRLYGCTAVRLYGCTAACRQVENPTAVSLDPTAVSLDSIKILVRLRRQRMDPKPPKKIEQLKRA